MATWIYLWWPMERFIKQNRGNRPIHGCQPLESSAPSDIAIHSAVAVDIDRDVDLDVVLSTDEGLATLENILHGQFHFQAWDERWGSLAKAKQLLVGGTGWKLFVGSRRTNRDRDDRRSNDHPPRRECSPKADNVFPQPGRIMHSPRLRQ